MIDSRATNLFRIIFVSILIVSFCQLSFAQDSAPKEPPYTDGEAELDGLGLQGQPSEPGPLTKEIPSIDGNEKKQSDIVHPSLKQEATVNKISPNARYVHHPDAEKGLIKITADGAYIYKTKRRSSANQSVGVRLGMIAPPSLSGPTGQSFKSMYTANNLAFLQVDYEWQPFKKYGKLGVQLGGGIFTASGQGHFSDNSLAQETYTFICAPISAGVVYRLEWMKRQWLAPYISGGGMYIPMAEIRDDNKINGVGVFGGYGGGGVLVNLTALDRDFAFQLDREYAIANLWLSADAKVIKSASTDIDVSSTVLSIGIITDF